MFRTKLRCSKTPLHLEVCEVRNSSYPRILWGDVVWLQEFRWADLQYHQNDKIREGSVQGHTILTAEYDDDLQCFVFGYTFHWEARHSWDWGAVSNLDTSYKFTDRTYRTSPFSRSSQPPHPWPRPWFPSASARPPTSTLRRLQFPAPSRSVIPTISCLLGQYFVDLVPVKYMTVKKKDGWVTRVKWTLQVGMSRWPRAFAKFRPF